MSAHCEILIDKLDDAVHVPVEAVFEEDNRYYVYVTNDGGNGCHRRYVEIGPDNRAAVSIMDGLSEGERVLLYDPTAGGAAGAAATAEEALTSEGSPQ
jgi:macrolide-specific efflux system membrane fusion protein